MFVCMRLGGECECLFVSSQDSTYEERGDGGVVRVVLVKEARDVETVKVGHIQLADDDPAVSDAFVFCGERGEQAFPRQEWCPT